MLIRPMTPQEYPLLDEFLYQAIFVPEGTAAPDRSIIQLPELQLYVKVFGKSRHDQALAAEIDGKIAGAAWSRIMNDYGHLDDETPSLSISLFPAYRGQGIGTALLKEFLDLLKTKGYQRVSLSVQKENKAFRMYQRAGFKTAAENAEDVVTVCDLQN